MNEWKKGQPRKKYTAIDRKHFIYIKLRSARNTRSWKCSVNILHYSERERESVKTLLNLLSVQRRQAKKENKLFQSVMKLCFSFLVSSFCSASTTQLMVTPKRTFFLLYAWRKKFYMRPAKRWWINLHARVRWKMWWMRESEWVEKIALKEHWKKGSAGNWETRIRLTLIRRQSRKRNTEVRSNIHSIIPFFSKAQHVCATNSNSWSWVKKSFVIL